VPEPSVPFVGRDDALKQLDAALARATAGEGSVVLVYGEAGIGKTRLCEQAGQAHRSRGGLVLVGRAAQEETGIIFAPIADALRAARRAEPAVWQAATSHADVLSAVVPELASAAGGGRCYADRPVLFEALLDAVEEAARADQAVLWVLDDVHWADDASWHFIGYAARRVAAMNLVLAVSYRGEEIGPASPRWTSLVQLKRDPHVLTVPLDRLSAADTGRLIGALAPGLPEELAAEIVRRSAGTPLLIEALAIMAASSGALPDLPDVALATVRERAARLTPAGRDLLDVAAVAGLTAEEQLLARLRPDASVGELIAAGLLDSDGEKYRFGHPLFREAAQAEVPPQRQRELHGELAWVLAGDGTAAAELVAVHLERAGRPAEALAVLEQGAEEARAAEDVSRCATLRLAAFRLARSHEVLRSRWAGLEQDAIEFLFLARRWTELDPLIRDAWSRRDGLPPPDRAGLALVLSWMLFSQGRVTDAWELTQRELTHLEPERDVSLAASLLIHAGSIAWYQGEFERAGLHIERGLKAAGEDTVARWWAQHERIHVDYGRCGDRKAAISALRDGVAAARAAGITDGEATAAFDLACHTAAPSDIEQGMQAAARAGTRTIGEELEFFGGMILLLEGRLDQAESRFVRLGRLIRYGEPVLGAWVDVGEAMLHLHRGDLGEARRLLYGSVAESGAAQIAMHAADRAAALGWLAWEQDRWDEAARYLDTSLGKCWSGGCGWHTLVGGPVFLPLHADALLRSGREADAAAVIKSAPPDGSGARFYDAGLAAARFRVAPSPELAAEARSAAASAPWPWLSGLVMLWQGEFLGDAEAAAGSAVLFEDTGAPLGARRAERVLSRLGVRRQVPATAGPLSQREMEVAQLVAEGLSNPAIAARLYLSRPTVASHVTHILTKLGFSSRAQVAAWVAGQRSGGPA
jgi:DNA-binding CsgD family transcriptional regulator